MNISNELHDKIFAFYETQQFNDYSGIEGNFWRMLYLSAMTITTTGYGDIVPLTTNARMCVAIEAIIGIILIGLFINSVSNSHKN